MVMDNSWFVDWFNTKYYHILYKNRDDDEAQTFIDNLLARLNIKAKSKILDVACGKGRHSKYLNNKGFNVTGIDLSNQSIKQASEFENDNLSFFEHDMRLPFRVNYFDTALNLFTSLGYFEDDDDNFKAIASISKSIKPEGYFVVDFFNSESVIKNLVPFLETEIDGIKFSVSKKISNGYVIKNIEVNDAGKLFNYSEKVQLITLPQFEKYFAKANLTINWIAGDYLLNSFEPEGSSRLIICGQKIMKY
jgi:SAM-dependent methyltransferase